MRIVNGEIRGCDINFNSEKDIWHPVHSIFLCSIMLAYEKVLFQNCTFNNPIGAVPELACEKVSSNDYNKALRIIEPENISKDDWVYVTGQTFDFCFFPIKIYGVHCEITYTPPVIYKSKFTLPEWNKINDIYQKLGISTKFNTLTDRNHDEYMRKLQCQD